MKTIEINKANTATLDWQPLEKGAVRFVDERAVRVSIRDAVGRVYFDATVRGRQQIAFAARGAAGIHSITACDAMQRVVAQARFRLAPCTALACDQGPYADLALRLQNLMTQLGEQRGHVIGGRFYQLLVCWLRDHTYVLKAQKYYLGDVKSGVEFFLERQQPNGMIWDDVHENTSPGHPSWFGAALGSGWHTYEENKRWVLRRIPVEADVEYLLVEAVWHAWKATGDDAWLCVQMPRLVKAVRYMTTDPVRWSRKHGLVKRGYTMDSWDFTNPRFYCGDHRLHPRRGDPYFLFHGDNSGCYAAFMRLAEMDDVLGKGRRAAVWRQRAEALRRRANARLWHAPCYAHMVPEHPRPEDGDLVRRDQQRLSLSTGYTLNRGLPTHDMAVQVLREYRRRGQARRGGSFAEWWTMDPMYTRQEWPDPRWEHTGQGEYMNGSITPLVAGELARAAFEHGMEDYGADILRRVWDLSERDGGYVAEAYSRTGWTKGDLIPPPPARFTPVDLRRVVNVGLKNGAWKGIVAWNGEGDNDMRHLPVGDRVFQSIRFRILNPAANCGRAVLALGNEPGSVWTPVADIPVGAVAASLYFLHATGKSSEDVVATYDVLYTDGTKSRLFIKPGREIGHWWNAGHLMPLKGHSAAGTQHFPGNLARLAWVGSNPVFKTMGVYMFGWNNPYPGKPITSLRLVAAPGALVMVCAISRSDRPVAFERSIRSYGLPETWAQGAVYHALAEGLAGITDTGRAFSAVCVSPRWAVTEARRASVCLHYPAGGGYCAYTWRHDARRKRVIVDVTGSFDTATVRLLLPRGVKPKRVLVDGVAAPLTTERIERSIYAIITLDHLPRKPVTLAYGAPLGRRPKS